MKTIIYNEITNEKKVINGPYIVKGQLVTELPYPWHVLSEQEIIPEYNTETHYLVKQDPVPDLENNKWIVEWVATEIPPVVPEIPTRLTPRQLRLGLLQAKGITPDVIKGMLGGNTAAIIEWEYATYTDRSHPMVAMLSSALNMTSEDVDNFFIFASTL